MKKCILVLLILITSTANAKLLDKVVGVINNKVFTSSEIKRFQQTIPARREISPFIYTKKKYSNKEIIKLLQKTYIIKDKLNSVGFVISDDSVESRIKNTEKKLGLRRSDLLDFLKSKNISFNEYFEVIRETMEFNVFNSRIIAPLVAITEPELKNYYYKQNSKNKALSFKYKVIDFYLPQSDVVKSQIKNLPGILSEYQKTGNIPRRYKDIQTNDLGSITDDDVSKELSKLLKKTDEGAFSKPYLNSGLIHIFYVQNKDLTESQDFLRNKNKIYEIGRAHV